MSHSVHPDIHERGLADGCARCAEIAEDPFTNLDERGIVDLVSRALANRFGDKVVVLPRPATASRFGTFLPARSDTEALAMAAIITRMEQIGQTAKVVPELTSLYLKERWHTELPWQVP